MFIHRCVNLFNWHKSLTKNDFWIFQNLGHSSISSSRHTSLNFKNTSNNSFPPRARAQKATRDWISSPNDNTFKRKIWNQTPNVKLSPRVRFQKFKSASISKTIHSFVHKNFDLVQICPFTRLPNKSSISQNFECAYSFKTCKLLNGSTIDWRCRRIGCCDIKKKHFSFKIKFKIKIIFKHWSKNNIIMMKIKFKQNLIKNKKSIAKKNCQKLKN